VHKRHRKGESPETQHKCEPKEASVGVKGASAGKKGTVCRLISIDLEYTLYVNKRRLNLAVAKDKREMDLRYPQANSQES
jgi:hypothetical protein